MKGNREKPGETTKKETKAAHREKSKEESQKEPKVESQSEPWDESWDAPQAEHPEELPADKKRRMRRITRLRRGKKKYWERLQRMKDEAGGDKDDTEVPVKERKPWWRVGGWRTIL